MQLMAVFFISAFSLFSFMSFSRHRCRIDLRFVSFITYSDWEKKVSVVPAGVGGKVTNSIM